MATGDRRRVTAAARAAGLFVVAAMMAGAAPRPVSLTTDGLGRTRFGMSVAQVQRALGAPLAVEYPQDKSCGEGWLNRADNPRANYLFEKGRLARVDISTDLARPQRPPITAYGIRIGSAEAAVLKRFPRAKVEPHKYDEAGKYLTIRVSGQRGILFETHKGRVSAMRTGLYPALEYVEGCL